MKTIARCLLPLLLISMAACAGKSVVQPVTTPVEAPQKYCPRPLPPDIEAVPETWEQEGELTLVLMGALKEAYAVIDCYEGKGTK